jgi:hypothetical protein
MKAPSKSINPDVVIALKRVKKGKRKKNSSRKDLAKCVTFLA